MRKLLLFLIFLLLVPSVLAYSYNPRIIENYNDIPYVVANFSILDILSNGVSSYSMYSKFGYWTYGDWKGYAFFVVKDSGEGVFRIFRYNTATQQKDVNDIPVTGTYVTGQYDLFIYDVSGDIALMKVFSPGHNYMIDLTYKLSTNETLQTTSVLMNSTYEWGNVLLNLGEVQNELPSDVKPFILAKLNGTWFGIFGSMGPLSSMAFDFSVSPFTDIDDAVAIFYGDPTDYGDIIIIVHRTSDNHLYEWVYHWDGTYISYTRSIDLGITGKYLKLFYDDKFYLLVFDNGWKWYRFGDIYNDGTSYRMDIEAQGTIPKFFLSYTVGTSIDNYLIYHQQEDSVKVNSKLSFNIKNSYLPLVVYSDYGGFDAELRVYCKNDYSKYKVYHVVADGQCTGRDVNTYFLDLNYMRDVFGCEEVDVVIDHVDRTRTCSDYTEHFYITYTWSSHADYPFIPKKDGYVFWSIGGHYLFDTNGVGDTRPELFIEDSNMVIKAFHNTEIPMNYQVNTSSIQFSYRKPITIHNPDNEDYKDVVVKITVDTQTPIFEGKMRSDCGDIRFSLDGTYIPYYLDNSTCGTGSTEVYLKLPYLPANGDVTVYMYYGNPSLESASGEDIFGLFDDFNGNSINTNIWSLDTSVQRGSCIVENGMLKLIPSTGSGWGGCVLRSHKKFGPGAIFIIKYDSYSTGVNVFGFSDGTNVPDFNNKNAIMFHRWYGNSKNSVAIYRDGTNIAKYEGIPSSGVLKIEWYVNKIDIYYNDVLYYDCSCSLDVDIPVILSSLVGSNSGGHLYVDYVYVLHGRLVSVSYSTGSEENLTSSTACDHQYTCTNVKECTIPIPCSGTVFVQSTYSFTANGGETYDTSEVGLDQFYSPAPGKNATLTVSPTVGGSNTIFTFTVTTTATTPYNVTWHFYDTATNNLIYIAEANNVNTDTVDFEAYGSQFGVGTYDVNATIIDADGDTIYTNTETFTVTSAKTVQLEVSPEVVYAPGEIDLTLYTSNLAKPYEVYLYHILNGQLQTTGHETGITDDVYSVRTGVTEGNWTFYMKVIDADNEILYTNNVTVQAVPGIQPFSITVTPDLGTQFTKFTLQTTNIYGGHPPYTIHMEIQRDSTVVADWIACDNLQENQNCTYNFTLVGFNPDTYYIFVKAEDDISYRYASNFETIELTGAAPGPPLVCNLTILGNYTNKNILQAILHVEGGAKPYYVSWYDYSREQCTNEEYNIDAPFDIAERIQLFAGDHKIQVSVVSSDGQVCTDSVTLHIDYEEGGVSQNIWYDCIGNISTEATTCGNGICEPQYGENYVTCPQDCKYVPPTPVNVTTPLHIPPFINATEWKELGIDWALPFVSLEFWVTVFGLILSGFVTKLAQGDARAFGISMLVWIGIFTIAGIYPAWLILIIATGIGLLIFYIWQKGGG